jgi:hypothetical protein
MVTREECSGDETGESAPGWEPFGHAWRSWLDWEPFVAIVRDLAAPTADPSEDPLRQAHERFQALLRLLAAQPDVLATPFGHGLPPELLKLLFRPEATPQLGPLQHRQARARAASAAWEEFIQAQQQYLDLMQHLAERTVEALSEALREAPENEPAQARYARLLSAAEAAHEAFIRSDEYATTLGRLSSAGSSVISHARSAIEDILALFDLPTRAELASTQRRLHEIRRQQYALAEAVDAGELQALRSELAELRREVAALRSALGSGG